MTVYVDYHSPRWAELTEQGWITMYVVRDASGEPLKAVMLAGEKALRSARPTPEETKNVK